MTPVLSRAEYRRRERGIQAQEWDDMWITLYDGRQFFSQKTVMEGMGIATFHTKDGPVKVDLAEVRSARH